MQSFNNGKNKADAAHSVPTIRPKSVIVYSNILYTFAFVNDIKKWNKAVRSFVVKTVSNV